MAEEVVGLYKWTEPRKVCAVASLNNRSSFYLCLCHCSPGAIDNSMLICEHNLLVYSIEEVIVEDNKDNPPFDYVPENQWAAVVEKYIHREYSLRKNVGLTGALNPPPSHSSDTKAGPSWSFMCNHTRWATPIGAHPSERWSWSQSRCSACPAPKPGWLVRKMHSSTSMMRRLPSKKVYSPTCARGPLTIFR